MTYRCIGSANAYEMYGRADKAYTYQISEAPISLVWHITFFINLEFINHFANK